MSGTTARMKGFGLPVALLVLAAFLPSLAAAQAAGSIPEEDGAAQKTPGASAILNAADARQLDAESTSESGAVVEHWYQMLINDDPAGWLMTRRQRRASQWITENATVLEIARGGVSVRFETASRFVEQEDGTPVSAWSRQVLGEQPIEASYRFVGDEVEVTTAQGERVRTKMRPRPTGSWLTPVKAQEALAQAVAAGTSEFRFLVFDPLLGLEATEVSWQQVSRQAQIAVPAGTFASLRYEQRMSVAPALVTTVDLGADAELIASTVPMFGVRMRTVLADRETAMAKIDAPELLVSSFVYPDRPIARPRALRRGVYQLRVEGEGAMPSLPSIGAQTLQPNGDGVRVRVDLETSTPTIGADVDRTPYLASSTYLDHKSDVIRALHATIEVEPRTPAAGRAEALRRFVFDHLNAKNLDSLLATAVEVAASRSGDCTEHSVLLAALLRADGIPSRVVTGLIYVDRFVGASDLFGYHMWTQALIEDRWVDLDATLEQPFDAAHIAFGTSALGDDHAALVDLAAIVPLIGRLRIDVIETSP